MHFEATGIPGCYAVHPPMVADGRGSFVKTYHAPTFAKQGLRTDWCEEFYSASHRGVVRGMHFQLPPAEHAKLVYCVSGSVLDVVVDLRRGSPAEGRHFSLELSAQNGVGLYIPSGCAHGFVSTSDLGTMLYKVSSVYAREQDAGIAWDSIGFEWPGDDHALSPRDLANPPLAGFDSPFTFDIKAPAR